MLLNDRSLTDHKDGLSNSFNLTNQDFYVRLEYKKTKKTIASLQAVCRLYLLPPALILTSLPFYGLPHRLALGVTLGTYNIQWLRWQQHPDCSKLPRDRLDR